MLYYSSLLTLTQVFLNLHNFVANLALSRLRAFGGALLAKIWWRGAQKHFSGPGLYIKLYNCYFDLFFKRYFFQRLKVVQFRWN